MILHLRDSFKIFLLLSLLHLGVCVGQESQDPDYIKENLPQNPEVGSLGSYGDVSNNPYNGKVNLSVPIQNLAFEGLQIPISLSYNAGGLQPSAEASWVGLNWNLSGSVTISRKIFGNDDLNENYVPTAGFNDISAMVYNTVGVNQQTGSIDFEDIKTIHSSFGTPSGSPHAGHLTADTQPDIFEVSLYGRDIKFRLNKRIGTSAIIDAHVFDNNLVQVTYDLVSKEFEIKDDRGFTFIFGTKNYSATASSTKSSTGIPDDASSGVKEFTINGLASDRDLKANTSITSWLLDSITAYNGEVANFSYTDGVYLTYPQYSGTVIMDENNIDSGDELGGAVREEKYTSSMSIMYNNYLDRISGPFGELVFHSTEDRNDLAEGKDLKIRFNSVFTGIYDYLIFTDSLTIIDQDHGTGNSDDYNSSGRKLNSVEMINIQGNPVKNIDFHYSYFNENSTYLNTTNEVEYLRLKLDSVDIQDLTYNFEYINKDNLPSKSTFATDFWGYYNGKLSNTTNVPSLGRFGTTEINRIDGPGNSIGHTYFDFDGANKSPDNTYSQTGILKKIYYPTGGHSVFDYEGHTALIEAPVPYKVTEIMTDGSSRLLWTDLIDEAKYKFTYLYLKNATDPTYNFFDNRFDPNNSDYGDETVFSYNATFTIGDPALVSGAGNKLMISGSENVDAFYDTPRHYLEDMSNPQNVYPIYIIGDWAGLAYGETAPYDSQSTFVPPGSYFFRGTQPDIDGIPSVALNNATFNRRPALSQNVFEEFEIGGLRIKTIENKGSKNEFISKKEFQYSTLTDDVNSNLSSGKLMDDLIFHTKYNGFYSYTPQSPGYGTGPYGVNITSNNNIKQNPAAQGSHIGYSYVRENVIGTNDEILTSVDRHYSNKENQYFTENLLNRIYYYNDLHPSGSVDYVDARNVMMLGMDPRASFTYSNGNILREEYYDCSGSLVKKTNRLYENHSIDPDNTLYASFNGLPLASPIGGEYPPWFENGETYMTYTLPFWYSTKSLPYYSQSTDVFDNGEFYNESYSYYDENQNLIKSESILDNDKIQSTQLYYPYSSEVSGDGGMSLLRIERRYSQVVQSKSYIDDVETAISKFSFSENSNTGNNLMVSSYSMGRGAVNLESRELYEKYDTEGNLLQKRLVDGTPVSYIYGYHNELPIAKLEGATYSQIASFVANLQSKSDADNDTCQSGNCNESKLRNALDSLRNIQGLKNVLITTNTYNPLVGKTSVTLPNNTSQYFKYDSFNRLESVFDQDGNLLVGHSYNIEQDINTVLASDTVSIEGCSIATTDGNDTPIEIAGGRMSNGNISLNSADYQMLRVALNNTQTTISGNQQAVTFGVFPTGGSGNFEYRWRLKGQLFTEYSSSTTFTTNLDCNTPSDLLIDITVEVRDIDLNITERASVRHTISCN